MNPLENHGLILRELRKLQGLSVRKTAEKIERAIGWLSEIENGKGTARLTEIEFDRIVDALDGNKYRAMFKTWVANQKNQDQINKTYDGAVLKFIRIKKRLNLQEAAGLIGISIGYLCKLETGQKPMTVKLRYKMMECYGYNPTSFKNLATDPVRSKAVPLAYKFEILLRTLNAAQVESIYATALSQNNLEEKCTN